MSTNSPTTIRRVMVGGPLQALEKVRKIFETMGDNMFHAGDVGYGDIVKLVNNFMSLTSCAVIAENFVLGARAGIIVRNSRK